jgi:CRP-like cAMP-binding protein
MQFDAISEGQLVVVGGTGKNTEYKVNLMEPLIAAASLDVWAMGICILELYLGRPPLVSNTDLKKALSVIEAYIAGDSDLGLSDVKDAQLQDIVGRQLPPPWFVPGGTVILGEGVVPALQGCGPLDGFFVLLDGSLQVFKTFEFGEQAVYDFKTAAFAGAPGVAARPATTPFFGERVLCGLSGSRSATVKAIGPAELLNIPRAVWTAVYNRAMGRLVEEEQMMQMMREYALLLEGNHVELAMLHGKFMRQFANDKELPAPDLVEPERGHRKRRGSVTKVVTREEHRQHRRTSASGDPAAPKERARRKSVSTAAVSENLISSEKKATRYEGRSDGAKARRKSVADADGSAAAAAAAAAAATASFALPGQSLLEEAEEAEGAGEAGGKEGERRKKRQLGLGEEKKDKKGHGEHRSRRKSVDGDPGHRRRRRSVA